MSFLRSRRRTLTCVLTIAAVLGGSAAAHADPLPAGFKPFAADSIWNQAVRPDAPVAPNSATWVNWLTSSVQAHGAWVNTTTCGMPMYWASADTPKVAVALDHPAYMDPALIRAWSAVPIPPDAAPATNCGDKNFAVFQRQPDGRIFGWEFWSATKRTDGTWVAKWGGASTDVMADRGIASSLEWNDPTAPTLQSSSSAFGWNVTASSISMSAGVITLDDLARGSIDHAVSIATYDAAKGSFLWPAQRTDGASADAAAIPEGAHLRLDPSIDVNAMNATPLVKMIAKAAQKYGIVVRDRTLWNTTFYVQQPAPGAPNPLSPLLGGTPLDKAMLTFPWSRLQVLDAPACSAATWAECKATPRAQIDIDSASPHVGDTVAIDTSGSVLNQPRTRVEWDLDGDGVYETPGGTAIVTTFTPDAAGTRTIGVRITTRDGAVVTGTRTLTVLPAATASSAPAPAPTTLRPNAVAPKYFYPYNSAYTAVSSLSQAITPPGTPTSARKLYTSNAAGSATIDFDDVDAPAAGAASVQAYVQCAPARCLDLTVVDGTGTVLGHLAPAFGTNGWVTIPVSAGLSAGQLTGLSLKAAVRNGAGAGGNVSLSAVQAVVPLAG